MISSKKHMGRKRGYYGTVSRAVRRAVLLHLSTAVPLIVACGAPLSSPSEPADSGLRDGSGSGSSDGATADSRPSSSSGGDARDEQGGPCTIIPNTGSSSGNCPSLYYEFNGTATECGGEPDGGVPLTRCDQLCPATTQFSSPLQECDISSPTEDGNPMFLNCSYGPCVPGRRPAGLRPASPPRRPTTAASAVLAHMAYLEAASVHAFERLARELEAHGAPSRLRRAALEAAEDERAHARTVASLAARAGTAAAEPRLARGRTRSLEAIAIENAVEGCVNETFAAALALAQGGRAGDADVRNAMRTIGADELRHAELAWAVDRWMSTQLDPAARRRVRRARDRAAARLIRRTSRGVVRCDLVAALGLPTAAQASGMARELHRRLWS